MRIIFFGTPPPAAIVLQALVEAGQEIACVVTQPDRPKGRGLKLSFSPVKEIALQNSLPLEQPEKIKDNPVFISLLKTLAPDIGVIVAYGKILPPEILAMPKFGFVNVHASLLPKYRGAAPVAWAIMNGEKETGVTILKVSPLLDAGEIILQEKLKIEDEDTTLSLTDKLFMQGKDLLLEALKQIEKGEAKFIPQDETKVAFAPSLTKESGEINWKLSAREIHNRIRGLNPWPGAHTFYRQKLLKIWKSEGEVLNFVSGLHLPGEILEIIKEEGFIVQTGKGHLLIKEVQPEAKPKMKAYDFTLGHGVKTGEIFPS